MKASTISFFLHTFVETCSLVNDVAFRNEVFIELFDDYVVFLLLAFAKRECLEYMLRFLPHSVNEGIDLKLLGLLVQLSRTSETAKALLPFRPFLGL